WGQDFPNALFKTCSFLIFPVRPLPDPLAKLDWLTGSREISRVAMTCVIRGMARYSDGGLNCVTTKRCITLGWERIGFNPLLPSLTRVMSW
ncbi:hypothetical protein BaRGS_00006560, partial [Batillaria attramentaria]